MPALIEGAVGISPSFNIAAWDDVLSSMFPVTAVLQRIPMILGRVQAINPET